ncbi:AAA-domain-containing protein [Ramicandelaber brevisporus]|nr:AAA-domain-containing protein [Ramicandelaber brevisporus]
MRGFRAALELVSPSQLVGFEASIPKRSWTDIGGYSALISRIRQTLALIQSPLSNHQALGISPPRGILLHGASGCGKTLIAHAIANSTGLSVLEARPFELLSMYLGDTEANIRSLFKTARQMAPCIVLMDELDVLATKRETDSTASDGAGGLNERTLSTLLNEMDGVQDRKGVLIVGCTSRLGAVDEAIIRPGRFDLLLHVDYPTRADRRDILRILTADGKYSVNESEVDLDRIADMTDGFTGADLDAILRDAAVSTLRRDLTAQFINNDAILNAINDWYEAN